MRFTRNVKAISKLLLILLLLAATIVGAILSYLWVIGYYINLGIRVPEKTTVSITNVTFTPQNASHFNVTILNPSYSPSDANITGIATSTKDGKIHNVMETFPRLPYKLPKAKEKTFRCVWNWANYTGQTVKIIAFVADGSGPTFEAKTPLVDLEITDVLFNSTISVTRFNVTVQNSPTSVTHVNITGVSVKRENISGGNISIPLPYTLYPGDSVSFECTWNWTDYQDENVTVAVRTLQGYVAYYTRLTPRPVILAITNILFNVTDTTHFNVTVQNSGDSPTYVNITDITVTVENETFPEVSVVPSPDLPYSLDPGANVTFRCSWNWSDYREKNVTVTVYTLQEFTVSSTQATAARVILTVTEVLFDVNDPSYFNITVRNSEFSLENYVNITSVTVAVENGTSENIPVVPSVTLYANESVTFTSLWNWTDHWNEEVSITVHTLQGYSAHYSKVTPSPVMISDVLFDLSDTTRFNVTVKSSEFFSTYVLITNITAILENGTVKDVTVIAPTLLPYVLHRNESVVLVCSWNWVAYYNESITIVVNTWRGYEARSAPTVPAPVPVILLIQSVLFDTANTTYFNITVRNSEYSLTEVNITRITVTFENGTSFEVTLETPPSLPYTLYSNRTVTFKCSWNWTNYQGQNITVTVETLEGYKASNPYTIPIVP